MGGSAAGGRSAAIERYWPDVRRYLLRRVRSRSDADDLSQEVCLRFLMADEAVSPRKPLAYLYGIAANLLADYRTHATRERGSIVVDSELAETFMEQGSGAAPAISEDIVGLEQLLTRALSKLPPTHCSVLLAHKRDGMSYQETASRLNLSVHTVEKYVTQAKAQLRMMRWD
jgi:RNA polymerase sigma-70 factor (ECF subfamily)